MRGAGKKVVAVLHDARVMQLNRRILRELMGALTFRGWGDADLEEIETKAMKRLSSMELLGSQPWVFPYLVARVQGVLVNQSSKTGLDYKTTYRSVSTQEIPYLNRDGKVRWECIPLYLQSSFVNVDRQKKIHYSRTKRAPFELSLEASNRLAFPGRPDLYLGPFFENAVRQDGQNPPQSGAPSKKTPQKCTRLVARGQLSLLQS
jgi:hypothetical protein